MNEGTWFGVIGMCVCERSGSSFIWSQRQGAVWRCFAAGDRQGDSSMHGPCSLQRVRASGGFVKGFV